MNGFNFATGAMTAILPGAVKVQLQLGQLLQVQV